MTRTGKPINPKCPQYNPTTMCELPKGQQTRKTYRFHLRLGPYPFLLVLVQRLNPYSGLRILTGRD